MSPPSWKTELKDRPEFVGVNSDFDKATPSAEVHIDRDRAAALGVTPQQIENAMGYAFGGEQVSQILDSSDQYPVMLELLPQLSKQCQRAALALHHREKRLAGAAQRGDQYRHQAPCRSASIMPANCPSVTVSFDLAQGYSLSDAVTGIQKASRRHRHAADRPGLLPGHRRRLPAIHRQYAANCC